MSMLDIIKKQRSFSVLSKQKRKLTLSSSKVQISSLSTSLIKFFEVQNTDQKDDQLMQKRLKRSHTTYSSCINSKQHIINTENKIKNQKNKSYIFNEYGFPFIDNKKKHKQKKTYKPDKREPKYNEYIAPGLRNPQKSTAHNKQNLTLTNSYLNFTFGNNKLNLNSNNRFDQ